MTVLNNDGLVGRVLRVTRTTATVLLVVDADSTVGGRIGESMELGFLHGRGVIGGKSRLDLELLDQTVVPAQARHRRDVGQRRQGNAGPYVAGVPVGEVTSVYSSLRETSQRAVIDPFVDFTELDLVGVVVASGSTQRPRRHRGRREHPMSALTTARAPVWSRSPCRSPWSSRPPSSPTSPGTASCPTWCCSSWSLPGSSAARSSRWCSASAPGLLLDLAPPADHVAGRWALALLLAGYVAGRVRQDTTGRRARR